MEGKGVFESKPNSVFFLQVWRFPFEDMGLSALNAEIIQDCQIKKKRLSLTSC